MQGSRRKSSESWEDDRRHLTEQEKQRIEAHEPAGNLDMQADPMGVGLDGFDEQRRGRPGN
jgi:hypothetical protein